MRKPRGEDDWYTPQLLGVGTLHAIGDDPDRPESVGVIWVPDPEQRRGWREFYVKGERKPGGRPVGFGKP